MKIKFNEKEINPVLIHAAGRIENNELWNNLITIPIKKWNKSQSIAVITWNNKSNNNYKSYKKLGLFEACCDKLEINYTVLKSTQKWTNRLKIPLTLNFLYKCKEKFILAADSSDVFAFGLPDPAILQIKKCNMLFNAETMFWPDSLVELKSKENNLEKERFKYLNSGLWLGEREYAIEIFEILNKMYKENHIKEYAESDQVLFKNIYTEKYPLIKIDSNCEIFLNCAHIKKTEIEFKNISHKLFV